MLQCCKVPLLQCCNVTMLQGSIVEVLQCCNVALLPRFLEEDVFLSNTTLNLHTQFILSWLEKEFTLFSLCQHQQLEPAPNFYWINFVLTIFIDQFFWPHIFLGPNSFLDSKYLLTKNCIGPQSFLVPKLFWTKIFFIPNYVYPN